MSVEILVVGFSAICSAAALFVTVTRKPQFNIQIIVPEDVRPYTEPGDGKTH